MIYSWFTLYVFNHIVLILKLFIFIICFKISKKVMYVWFQFYNKSNYANGSNSIKCVHQLFVHYTIYIQFMTSPFDPVMHDFFLKGRLPNPEILIYYTVTQLHCVHCTVSTLYCVRWTVEYKYSLYLLTLVWMEEGGGGLFICQSINQIHHNLWI